MRPLGVFIPLSRSHLNRSAPELSPALLLSPSPRNRIDLDVSPPSTTSVAPERMRVKTLVTWKMKASPSKSVKTGAGKKRTRSDAEDAATKLSPPSTLRPNPAKEWKKAKLKTEDLLALVNSGFLREKEMDLWRAATGDPCLMEKNPDEIPMSA
jgi:hypothetical protein